MSEHIVAVTTLGSEEAAEALATSLLERGLVACVNVLPQVRSLYTWKGAIARDSECLLMMKTRIDAFEALAEAVDELHPYEVPELIALPVVAGAKSYLAWLDESLTI